MVIQMPGFPVTLDSSASILTKQTVVLGCKTGLITMDSYFDPSLPYDL